jgi:hypothetical protein
MRNERNLSNYYRSIAINQMYICVHICTYMCTYVCINVYICVHICVHICEYCATRIRELLILTDHPRNWGQGLKQERREIQIINTFCRSSSCGKIRKRDGLQQPEKVTYKFKRTAKTGDRPRAGNLHTGDHVQVTHTHNLLREE